MSHDSVEFDPFSDTFFDDPSATSHGPARRGSRLFRRKYGFYALSRHADVVAAHGDPVRFVSSYGVTLELLLQKRPMNTNMMIVMDPPQHTRMRKPSSQACNRNGSGSIGAVAGPVLPTSQCWSRREAELTMSRTDPLRRHDLAPELEDLPATVPAALRLRVPNGADPFVIGAGFRLSFAEADTRSAELAGRLLACGIGKGARVGVLFANGATWAVTWLALARIGALTVPLSTFAPGVELARMVRQTDLHALVMSARFGGEPHDDPPRVGPQRIGRESC